MSEIIVGLDIGSKQVSIVAGRLDNMGKLEILGLGKADTTGQVSKGVVLNVNKTIDAVRSAIMQVEQQANIDIRGVIASVAGPNIVGIKHKAMITRNTSGEEVTVTDVDQVASDAERTFISQGNSIVHTLPQEYVVDSSTGIQEPVGISGLKLQGDFLMITSPTLTLDKTKRCIERAKEKMEIEGGLVFSPLAASLAVLSEQEKKSGVALVDIGSGTTEIAIFYKNIVRYISVLPYAGDIITADIEQGCNVSNEHAEVMKVRFGNALASQVPFEETISIPGINGRKPKVVSVKNLSIIIEERLKEIAALVVAEISRSGFGNRLSCGIVLTGGSVQMPNICELFEKVTGRDVRLGYPNENLGRSVSEDVKNPSFATAVGLVWNGLRSIDEREDSYKILRKTEPKVIPPVTVQSNTQRKREQEREKEPKTPKKSSSWIDGLKRFGKGLLGDDIRDEDDKY
ncbi:MAG: cell division protein FtsA [Flectobacillus sp.]|uniref:cell division protein FtsA n=1 Tax=Flectobacillus sp. TaxID=50419 RepID=UPI003B9CE2F1